MVVRPSLLVLTGIASAAPLSSDLLPPDFPAWLRLLLLLAAPSCVGLAWWAFATMLRVIQGRYVADARAKRARAAALLADADTHNDDTVPGLLRDAEISEETARALGRQIDNLPKPPSTGS